MNRHNLLAVMTPFPWFIDGDADLDAAQEMMTAHGIHHLPVKHDGALIGIISAEQVCAAGRLMPEPDLLVRLLCDGEPLQLDAHCPVADAARAMADDGHSAALVMRDGRMAGIFTASDALRLLAETLDPQIDDGVA